MLKLEALLAESPDMVPSRVAIVRPIPMWLRRRRGLLKRGLLENPRDRAIR